MAAGFRTCHPTDSDAGMHPLDRSAMPRGPAGLEHDPFRDPDLPGDCDEYGHWHGFSYPEHSRWDLFTARLERWRDRLARAMDRAVASNVMRSDAALIALAERAIWISNNLTENRRAGQNRIRRYWREGVGRIVSRAEARDEAWSAAFIDFVLRQAGAGDSFQYAWKHVTYIKAAIHNLEQNRANSFKAYKIDDPRSAPDVGDLVCNWRETRRSYDDIAAMSQAEGYTHCDLVVHKEAGKIELVGGNKTGGVVGMVEIALDQNGLVRDDPQDFYIAVLKHS